MTDIVERLRSALPTHREDWDGFDPIMAEAADEIEKLQRLVGDMVQAQHKQERTNVLQEAKIEKLQAALKGVIRVADRKTDEFDAARAALEDAQ